MLLSTDPQPAPSATGPLALPDNADELESHIVKEVLAFVPTLVKADDATQGTDSTVPPSPSHPPPVCPRKVFVLSFGGSSSGFLMALCVLLEFASSRTRFACHAAHRLSIHPCR